LRFLKIVVKKMNDTIPLEEKPMTAVLIDTGRLKILMD